MTKKILVPDTVVRERERAEARKEPPTCPVCRAKFSFDKTTGKCKKCGIPLEIIHMGAHMVARWKKQQGIQKPVGASKKNRPNKHGRKGVKR
jgi:predicted amidophosphoribosyltransferase